MFLALKQRKQLFLNSLQAFGFFLSALAAFPSRADDLRITTFGRNGQMTVTNTFTNGVVTVEKASSPGGPWAPEKNVFSLDSVAGLQLGLTGSLGFFRALAVDISTPDGFTNLVNSYSLLTTVAGAGGTSISPNNKWDPASEGGPAVEAFLSRPHIAMADRAGNIYIADKEGHAIRKVTLDGLIHTVAGINSPDYGTTDPAPATTVALKNPNGIWVLPDGTFYILDRDNGLIRRVDTQGLLTTIIDHGGPIPEGRGLWVSSDESVILYCAGTEVRQWDTTNGLSVLVDGFRQLGNLAVDPQGRLAVTDRGASLVYRIESDLTKTVIAGNGLSFGGGDGELATDTGLWQVRGIWFLPTGAYFLATDSGSQVWYVDVDGYIHLFLNGNVVAHDGDGSWFYDPLTPKVSKIRQITMTYDGDLIITENDSGYVRRVQFLRNVPTPPPVDPGFQP